MEGLLILPITPDCRNSLYRVQGHAGYCRSLVRTPNQRVGDVGGHGKRVAQRTFSRIASAIAPGECSLRRLSRPSRSRCRTARVSSPKRLALGPSFGGAEHGHSICTPHGCDGRARQLSWMLPGVTASSSRLNSPSRLSVWLSEERRRATSQPEFIAIAFLSSMRGSCDQYARRCAHAQGLSQMPGLEPL